MQWAEDRRAQSPSTVPLKQMVSWAGQACNSPPSLLGLHSKVVKDKPTS